MTAGRLLAVAHRAGNSLAGLQQARDLGADVIEADVYLYRDRLEVRHLKTMGPLPWLWDRWELRSAHAPRLGLADLLTAAPGEDGNGVTFMLDLKGHDPAVGEAVAAALRDHQPCPQERRQSDTAEGTTGDHREVLVCTRHWPALQPFESIPWVRTIRSARTPAELAPLLAEPLPGGRRGRRYGVSVHRRLLRPDVVAALHQRVEVVLTWPINDDAGLAEVRGYAESGTIGVISDEVAVLRRVLALR